MGCVSCEAIQAATDNQSLIESIMSSPSAIASLSAMLVTVVLFLINVFVIRRNNSIEFQRKVDLNYYEITVLFAMKDMFKLFCGIKNEFSILKSKYNNSLNQDVLIEICQGHISVIDEHVSNMESNSLVYIAVFSSSAGEEINKVIENFYDDCTDLFSKFSSSTLTSRNINSLSDAFNLKMCDVVKNTYEICKQQNP